MADQKLTEIKQRAAKNQGAAYKQALTLMQDDVDSYKTKESDNYIVTLACEEAEGMYRPENDQDLTWQVPDKGMNKHLEIAVQDKYDGRFVPALDIHVKATSPTNGNVAYDDSLPFLWHPFLWHYGSNWQIDDDGSTYDFVVTIAQPTFGRHDEQNGKRYPRAVTLEFGDFELESGREPHGAE